MNNVTKSFLLTLSTLLVAGCPATQAAEHHGRHNVDYGHGVKMAHYDDNSGFVMTVKDGPSFEFDSRTQSVVLKNVDGTSQVVKLNN